MGTSDGSKSSSTVRRPKERGGAMKIGRFFTKLLSTALASGVIGLACYSPAHAIPIGLLETGFDNISGGARFGETFLGFSTGSVASPLVTFNGTYRSDSPFITDISSSNCSSFRCLSDSFISGPRTFDTFRPGTTAWAADITLGNTLDDIEITVVGNSGIQFFDLLTPDFFGVTDPTGLVSVSFVNRGRTTSGGTARSSYGFDTVITFAPFAEPDPEPDLGASVPEPGTLALFGIGFVGLGYMRRRRKAAKLNSPIAVA